MQIINGVATWDVGDIVYDIDVDFHNKAQFKTVPLHQYDYNSTYLVATVWDCGNVYTIPTGATVTFNATKPDGKGLDNPCDVVNNQIIYQVTEQTTVKDGDFYAEFRIYDTVTNTDQTTTPRLKGSPTFKIYVEKSALSNDTVISTDEFNVLTDLITDASFAISNANTATTDAITATTNANTATATVTQTNTTVNTAEQTRIANENERVTNDLTRPLYFYVTQAEYDALPQVDKDNPKNIYEITDNDGILPTELQTLIDNAQAATDAANQAASGVLPDFGTTGIYTKVTTDAKGRVQSGSNPSNIADLGITNVYTKTEIDTKTGDLTTLQTQSKDSLTNAINELDADIGDTTLLTTTDKSNTVVAINEVNSQLAANTTQVIVNTNNIANHTSQIASLASGSPKGVYTYYSDLVAAFPSGNSNIYLVTGNKAEVDTLTVTAIPTVNGNITITLNGVAFTVAVTTSMTTTDLVATAIRGTTFTGWTTGGSASVVTFTKTAVGTCSTPVFSGGSTGVTSTFTVTTKGAALDGNWYYWNSSTWTSGGVYRSNGIAENEINKINLADNAISISKLDKDVGNLLGVEKLENDWVLGAIQSGNINTLAHIAVSTNNFISLDKNIKIIFSENSNAKYEVAYYNLDGTFTGLYSSWFTTSTIISQQKDKKIRITIQYNDGSLFTDIYPLMQYMSVVKEITSSIPSYWVAHVNSKIETIKSLQKSIGFNGTSFGFITDMHIGANSKNSSALLQTVMDECNIPYYFDGGDFTSGASNTTKIKQLGEINLVKSLFKPLESRCLRTLGNHDDNSIDSSYAKTLIDTEMYDALYRQNSKYQNVKNGETGEYYYIDDEMHKIRYINLNCIDIPYSNPSGDTLQYAGMNTWAFRQEQIDWFADIALNVPNNTWSVVVCSHIPINQGLIKNDSIMMNILQAFKDKTTYTGTGIITDFEVSKTVDYTGKGGDVICWIAGHLHVDSFVALSANITYKQVTTLNDSLGNVEGQPTKTLGTSTENAFDIFTINKTTRTVNITRIGAGSDRSFIY